MTLLAAIGARGADSPAKPSKFALPPPSIDPSTGLPLAPVWIDPNWKDPDRVLPEVTYDGLPVGTVADHLRSEFKGAFDILIPGGWQDLNNPDQTIDSQQVTIRMQLKNVTASEVFNAMNLMFEAQNEPYRWELRLNGNRPTARFRFLPQFLQNPSPPPHVLPKTRMVYFVGDLLDDAKTGGMTMERLVKIVSEVYQMSYGDPKGAIQFHKDAQLLVVTGTSDQTVFVQQTLSALRGKAQAAKEKPQPGLMPTARPEEKKNP